MKNALFALALLSFLACSSPADEAAVAPVDSTVVTAGADTALDITDTTAVSASVDSTAADTVASASASVKSAK